jgi:beta-galactosidase
MNFKTIDHFLHGGDYNVEQWLDRPDILSEDIRLMKLAGVNVVTLGVFSWACLEPKEGVYTFEWLDHVMDSMYQNGIFVILATPSGGKPPWMAKKYPDIMRTREDRVRHLYGERENQCNSNEVYREKVRAIDEELAKRYANHPALIMWHISNEMYGLCHCNSCQGKFREWLKKKYITIDNLNKQYWSIFWSHTYNDWDEIESPAPHGETAIHGLALDYKRFYSDLSIDFIEMEIETVKKFNHLIPTTSNMFHHDCGINYYDLSKKIDIISWDSYPRWHCGKDKSSEWKMAVATSFDFDFCHSLQQKPFLLMESTPSSSNGFDVCKLKRPKMHLLSGMQAIASCADSIQYFQWRKSLGAYEKFHGAVVSHNGSTDTRVFRDVCDMGEKLKEIRDIKGACTTSEVAIIFDWDNLRALQEQKNLKKKKKDFASIVKEHYEALLKNYISVDIIDQTTDFSKYKIVIAPVLYLLKPETSNCIREFIANGGTFVMTYYSGIVNENDLAFEGWTPYSLDDVFGIRAEEIDSLCDDEYKTISYNQKIYKALDYCELIHSDSAQILGDYESDFYCGMPAVTRNKYQKGTAYYLAFKSDDDFLIDFYNALLNECNIRHIVNSEYTVDVMIKERIKDNNSYVFLMNFSTEDRIITFDGKNYKLSGYDVQIITRELK